MIDPPHQTHVKNHNNPATKKYVYEVEVVDKMKSTLDQS